MFSLKEFKEVFDPKLQEFLNKKFSVFTSQTSNPFITDFSNHTKEILAGGKRLRPYLAYLMYSSLEGNNLDEIWDYLIALEVLHNSLLVHDDFMDKASTRHNVSTINSFVLEKLKEEQRTGDLKHVAYSQAVLVGDVLVVWAMQLFDKTNPKTKELFYQMTDEVIMGQMVDIDLTTKESVNDEEINEKILLKSSGYSFIKPLQVGASLADKDFFDFCRNLGEKLGFAFQMQDDMLDLTGDPKVLHKSVFTDIAANQPTFFTNFVFHNGTDEQKEKLREYFGKEVSSNDYETLRNVFTQSGAFEEGKKLIEENLSKAQKIVDEGEISIEGKEKFSALINIIGERKS